MSHTVKLNFQPLPNLPYVQGYPGIIGSPYRKPPAVQGLLEVRVGKDQIKAKQIQIEFIQVEHLPGSTQVVASPIGSPINVWSASNGSEWEYATNADYRFYIPLPLNLPGSVELKQKGGAIRYELQANFFHKPKSGLLRKETTPITQVIKPIYIGKMELLAAWPVYNIPEVRQTVFEEMELSVTRPFTAFGPGDRIEVHATLRCLRPKPLKVRAFILTMQEILTIRLPSQKGVKQNAVTRTKVVHEAKVSVNEKIARSEEMRRTIPMIVPAGLVANTIRNGRAIELQYELSVKAVMEGMGDPKIEHLNCIVGTVPRARAHDIVNQIGFVDSLCPTPAGGRPASVRSNSTFAASTTGGFNQSGLQYGAPGSVYNSTAVSPPPALTTPPALQNRSSYYGNSLYATPPGGDLAPVRSRPQSSFVARPLSADASSLYSRRQSQSEISSLRDPRTDYLPPPRSAERPHSYATFGQSSNEVMNLPPDTRRMTYLGAGGHQYSQMTQSSLSVERPEGPVRMDSYASQVPSVRSREVQDSPTMQSNARSAQSRLSTESKSVYVPASPRPKSFVHTDAGRVVLSETGQPVVENQNRTETQASSTADQSRWAAAESEKQRLYVDARRRAALTQLAGGGELASMGLDELPQEEPPSYSPRDPAGGQQQSTSSTSIVVSSLATDEVSNPQGVVYPTTVPLSATGHMITSPESRIVSGLGIYNAQPAINSDALGSESVSSGDFHTSSADEKERMRMLFEQQDRQQGISSRPSASSLGHTSGNSSCMAAPPTTAHGTRSSEFLTAETEKDIMRRRYEAATRAVSGGPAGSSSSRSSFQDHSPRQSSISSSHDQSTTGHFAYQTAQEEKDQMRNRYEEAVNATSSLRIESEPWQPPASSRYASADEEKAIMRQRYEEAVAAAERQNSASSAITIPGPSRLGHVSPAGNADISRQRSGTPTGSDGSRGALRARDSYMTASQEKEQMRQRYEAAVRATQSTKQAESLDSDSGYFRPTRPLEQDTRFAERGSTEPPPLPARPPEVEQYKAIISSPTEERANAFLYMNSGMMPMYPMMFPGPVPVPGIDYTQGLNSYYQAAQEDSYRQQ